MRESGCQRYDGATGWWTRSFESGTEVTFNAYNGTGSVRWVAMML
jgi:hypothetical protein